MLGDYYRPCKRNESWWYQHILSNYLYNALWIQDYLRDQPDNIKSFNIVAETTAFLNMVYSNINIKTIDLVIQIFLALNEFASGCQQNRAVILTHKVVDYINFILRAGEPAGCPPLKVGHHWADYYYPWKITLLTL